MTADAKKSVSKSKRAGADLFEGLEDIRLKVVLTRAAIGELERAPVALSIASDRVDTWLADLHKEETLKLFVRRFMFPSYRAPQPAEALDFMMGILSQMVRGEMLKLLTANYGDIEGLTEADRKSQIEAKTAEALALELSEEAIIRHLEDLGLDILRRFDADPLAVLASKESLE
ncbi:hypothetical protein G6L97_00760 [Agrobacterium tumefaciens]|uniref:hypothetical protein n=1 Tax=Agrobacterium tumefaciens TaxID=358 RepID=UPI0015722D6E|nr:hypothetical protein [Agrobacterium tumefaciens]NSZ82937.1 hypothetical protein [Agrobacterium tumefaciens]WCA69170.1 hypothetical protein G6L97_00760 [Agrobacterium tumefaciens]